MAGIFSKGTILEQLKEPALSRDLRAFLNTNTNNTLFEDPGYDLEEGLKPHEIIEYARLANIIDERDGIPLHEKLSLARDSDVATIVADANDDEPYISSQINPLLKKQELAVAGLRLARAAAGAKNVYIAVYKNITDLDTKIPRKIDGIEVKRIRGRYPAEQRISEKFRDVRPIMLIGACALIHLARAVASHKVQTTCFVTVAGNCVATPCNLEVSIGMPIMQVLERCGLSREPNRIVLGGSMTGICCKDPEHTVVTATTRAILALRENSKDMHYRCIGCGRCVDSCPEDLSPVYLYKNIEHGRFDELRFYDIDRCIGCGTCSYVCPANLSIAATIKAAKKELAKRKGAAR